MKKLQTLLLAAAIFFQTATPSAAYTVTCTNCSQTAMQVLEYALSSQQLANLVQAYDQYVQQTAQQIEMVAQNVQQYSNMLQNTAKLPSNLIKDISGELSKLSQVTSSLNTLRNDVMGIAGVFDELYRSQDEFKNLANLPKELMGGSSSQYKKYWDSWSERVDESTKATFQLSAKQLQDLENSGQLESYINELLSTPDGQQKALMAGNQLAALQIQEARQLRELIATKFHSDLASQTKAEKEGQFSKEKKRAVTDFSKLDTNPTEDPAF